MKIYKNPNSLLYDEEYLPFRSSEFNWSCPEFRDYLIDTNYK